MRQRYAYLTARLKPLLAFAIVVVLAAGCSPASAPATSAPAAPAPPVAAAGSGAASAPAQPPATKETAIVAVPATTLVYLPVYIAQAFGFAAEEGLEIEVQPMQTNLSIVGLDTGQVDYTMAAGTAFRSAIQGATVRVIMHVHDKLGWYLTTQPDVTTFEQLVGKPIAVTSAASTEGFAVRAIAKKRGIDPGNLLFVTVGPTNLLPSLESGAVAAANLSIPLNTIARDLGYNWLLFVGDEFESSWSGHATSERKLREQPQQVKRMLRATLRGIDFIRSQRAATEAFMVKDWAVPEKLAAITYDVMLRTLSPVGMASEATLEGDAASSAEELNIPRSAINLKNLVDYGPLEEVLRETGRR